MTAQSIDTPMVQLRTELYERMIKIEREKFDRIYHNVAEDSRDDIWQTEITSATYRVGSLIDAWTDHVPQRYAPARIEALDATTQCQERIAAFLDAQARTLFLAGPIGTGKSYAAWAIGHEAVARRLTVRAWSVPRLLVAMRPDGDPKAFDRAVSADVLILDDLGAAKPTEWSTEQMYCIADARCSSGRKTVITTNGSYDSLCQMWGEPTMDRWHDGSTTAVFQGESRRKPSPW